MNEEVGEKDFWKRNLAIKRAECKIKQDFNNFIEKTGKKVVDEEIDAHKLCVALQYKIVLLKRLEPKVLDSSITTEEFVEEVRKIVDKKPGER